MNSKLNKYSISSALTGSIMGAYCTVCKMEDKPPEFKDIPCKFFYHWLGTQPTVDEKTNELSKILEDIYNVLKNDTDGHKCEVNYDDVDRDKFKSRKEVFDHYYNYEDVEKYVLGGHSNCLAEWMDYQGGIELSSGSSGSFSDSDTSALTDRASGGEGKGSLLGRLPSKLILYSDLNKANSSNRCNNADHTDEVEMEIKQYLKDGNHAANIVGAYCYVHDIKRVNTHTHDLCYKLYYWIGQKVKDNYSSVNTFPWAMMKIYDQLKRVVQDGPCGNMYNNIDGSLFSQRKIVYEYSEDYTTMEGHFTTKGESCDDEYKAHLEAIKKACTSVKPKCSGGEMDNPYCNHYNQKYKNYCEKKLSELENLKERKCIKPKPNPNPNQDGSSGSFTDSADSGSAASSALAPASVSGALAAVGLPALAFYLYKVINTMIKVKIIAFY
ncbi:Variable surface protein Vir7-like [Plasmodium coatneyi]|uniref:Variable surface protein Vir7-like n=1 Tax=Plasmodium coatneyi TaxID=208452 RepID=A0A1B1E5W2_9APIC|nr:Variable surface protein Vir7-like [Plasmodium coatneyi]ANQ10424.1 Variable surface protein Vir7-like [Plasmodium coatneyi]